MDSLAPRCGALGPLAQTREAPLINLLVGNLPTGVTEPKIRALFEQYGPVARVLLMRDQGTGLPRGFCFVDIDDPAQQPAAACGYDGAELDGQALDVVEYVRLSGLRWEHA